MGMEDIVLLGGFAATVIFGYCIMWKLDHFLDKVWQEKEEQERTICLNIATSCCNVIPTVSSILKDLNHLYPNVHCDLSVGLEQEVIKSLDSGDADVAIISADSDAESGTLAQWKWITLNSRSVFLDDGIVEVNTIEKNPQRQKVLWKSRDNQPLVLNFIHCLCGQRS